LPGKSASDLQVISHRLVRHWKSYLQTLMLEGFSDVDWLIRDTIQTSLALIKADIR
jgi:hypothetical protein